jgi:protein gp37
MDKRYGRVEWGAGKARARTAAANWRKPVQWDRQPFVECPLCHWRGERRGAAGARQAQCPACFGFHLPARRRVFCASLADVFDNEVDPAWQSDLFDLIRATPNLDWLLLTKRIGNAVKLLGPSIAEFPNVWLGATIVNQEEADRDIPKLLTVPARVRFLSCEPLLGPINLWPVAFNPCPNSADVGMDPTTGSFECCKACDYGGVSDEAAIDWIIAGGESGPKARPMHRDWARSLRDQCVAAGVPFHFKQWGEHAPNWLTDDAGAHEMPGTMWMDCMGKKAAGRMLDGRTWDEFPQAQ